MVNRLQQAEEKGVRVAHTIERDLIPRYGRAMSFRVLTVRNHLTKVVIHRIVEEPDAAGQGGEAPPS